MIGALVWGLVAGSAFILGGVLALRFDIGARAVGLLTGFGAGAMIAAVAYELVDEAGRLAGGYGHVALGLVSGSLLYLFTTGYWAPTEEGVGISFRSLAVTVIPEAIIIVGSLLDGHHFGAATIMAVFMCGVPEAFVVTGRLDEGGLSARSVMMVWTGLAVLCSLSAGIVFALLDGAPGGIVAFVLAVAGGVVLTELTTELVPEGRALAGPLAGTSAVVGFAMVFGLAEVV